MACECGSIRLEVAAQRAEILCQRELLHILTTTLQNVERQNVEILSKLTALNLCANTVNQSLPLESQNKDQQPISASQILENNLDNELTEETPQTTNYTPTEEKQETVAVEDESTSIVTTLEMLPPKVGVVTTADYTPTEEKQETVAVEDESTSIVTTLELLPPKVDQDDFLTGEIAPSEPVSSLLPNPEGSLRKKPPEASENLFSSVNSWLNIVEVVEAEDGSKSPEDGPKSAEDGSKSAEDGPKSAEDGSKSPENGSKSPEASDLAIIYSSVQNQKPKTHRSKGKHTRKRRTRFRQSGNLGDESIQDILASTSQRPKRISQSENSMGDEPMPVESPSDLTHKRLSKSKSSKLLLVCSSCTKTFNSYAAMRVHNETSSCTNKNRIVPEPIVKRKIFACFECGFETVISKAYLSHIKNSSCQDSSRKSRRLSGETDKCGKSGRLGGETAFKCDLCDFRSSDKSNIELHRQWHEQCE